MTSKYLLFCVTALLSFVVAPASRADAKAFNTTTFGNLALHGYDPVAYFSDHKPVEGRKDLAYTWEGATWRFASPEHLDLFKANPTKYAPQFGGYCAFAVSKGSTADVDPEAWEIVNEKLYLNYNKSIQAKWDMDRDRYIAQAQENWIKMFADKVHTKSGG